MTAVEVTPKAIKRELARRNAELPILGGRFVAKLEKSMGNVVNFVVVFEPPAPPPGEDLSCVNCGASSHRITTRYQRA